MSIVLSALRGLPEYKKLLDAAERGEAVALSGAGQIARSHFIAALFRDTGRPMVVVCQDDEAARRVEQELFSFLGEHAPILPSRDLTLYDAAVVSRGWEQKRLRQLYDLASGVTRLQIVSLESLCLRTMPRDILFGAALTLRPGASYDLEELTRRLSDAGYARTTLVEGVGQFALRGGILDVYSPAYDEPLRVEFFGDELDAMGFFDPLTQRRTENAAEAVLLPVAETEPRLHPGGAAGLAKDLAALIARQRRRKTPNEALLRTLEHDRELLENDVSFPAADRYMALIYPERACAADYLSRDALIVLCDHGNLLRAAKLRRENLGMELDGLLQSGTVAGELCDFSAEYEELFERFSGQPVLYLDNFLSSAYPETLPPKALLSVTARQLPPYGASLENAVQDLKYYQDNEFGALVLCGNRRRGEILQGMLREAGLSAFLAFPAAKLPAPGQILLTDGSLPDGVEYPALRLALLTEGQLLEKPERHKISKAPKKATNRQKLASFTDLTPGDLVVHEHHGIGRYVGMEQMKVDGAVKDYVKIAYQGTDTLYVPAT